MANEGVLDRIKSLYYLKKLLDTGDRIVTSRYSDGEYLLMNNMDNNTHDSFNILPALLKKSIKEKNQFVCINYLKSGNITNNDNWCKVQKYLAEVGEQLFYGCCNWNIYDFQNNNIVLPYLFSNKTLLITSHVVESVAAFKGIYPDFMVYEMPKINASSMYNKAKYELMSMCSDDKFDNILFSCGPIGKVLLTDLIPVCNSNLVDLGALLNAIINDYSGGTQLINQWTMSWVNCVDVSELATNFFNKLKDIKDGV